MRTSVTIDSTRVCLTGDLGEAVRSCGRHYLSSPPLPLPPSISSFSPLPSCFILLFFVLAPLSSLLTHLPPAFFNTLGGEVDRRTGSCRGKSQPLASPPPPPAVQLIHTRPCPYMLPLNQNTGEKCIVLIVYIDLRTCSGCR